MKNKILFFGVLFACLIAFTPKVYALDYDNTLFDNLPSNYGGNYSVQYQLMYQVDDEIFLSQLISENTFIFTSEVNHELNELYLKNFIQTSSTNPTTTEIGWGYEYRYKYNFNTSSWEQCFTGYISNDYIPYYNIAFPNRLIWSDFTLNTADGQTFFTCSSQDINSCIGIGSSAPGGGDTEEDDESILSTIKNWFLDLINAILDLPSKFLNLLKDIFVPDTEEIKSSFDTMISNIEDKFGIVSTGLEDLKDGITEEPIEDISKFYNIPGLPPLKLKFLDVSYLTQGIEYFRPILRGFIVLMLIFYNYKMILTFIGQDPGMYAKAKEESEK